MTRPSRSEFVTPGGVRLATLEWRGSGRPLYLMHATGFCGAVWDPIARDLSNIAAPRAMDARGHGASDRPDGDYPWTVFADDLLAWIDTEGTDPVWAIGHSSGATACALAAAREPERFEALLLVDPVLLRPPDERDAEEQKGGFGLADRTLRRRSRFASREAVREAYRARFPFSAFAPEVLELYLEDGLRAGDDGSVELACPPEIERRIYLGTAAVDPWPELPKIQARTRILVPELTGIRPELQKRLRESMPSADIVRVPGSHFVVMERPELVVAEARALFG